VAIEFEKRKDIPMPRVIEERKEVEVYAGQKGHVCIKQSNYHDEDMLIFLHPDDVSNLIDYLKEAQAEAYVIRASNSSAESAS
jgi:hypothetical protein